MQATTAILSHLDAAGLALIGVLAVVGWLRHRTRTRACLAAALGLLGLVSVVGQVQTIVALPWWAEIVNLVCFMGSGYALVELRNQMIPTPSAVRPAVLAILGLTTLAAIPITVQPVSAHPGVAVWVIVFALILEWAACIAEPAVRFLRASRGLPTMQRKRLRALSLGYLSLAVALVLLLGAAASVAAASAPPSEAAALLFQLVATAVIPLLYVGFAPPAWLRRSWRSAESGAYRQGNEALMAFTSDPAVLGAHAVEWATRFVGAGAGVLVAADGSVLAARGVDEAEAGALAGRVHQRSTTESAALEEGFLVVPVVTGWGIAHLAVLAGPFTPFFGGDEVSTLRTYADAVGIALGRVETSASLRRQTERMEGLLRAVSELGAGLVVMEEGQPVDANIAYLRMTGFAVDELESRHLLDLVAEGDRDRVAEYVAGQGGGSGPTRFETRLVRSDGEYLPVEIVVHEMSGDGPSRTIALVQDISARRRAETALAEAALLDPLTRVPNRRAWDEELTARLTAARGVEPSICVAVLDLDSFKDYNDDWGHQRGDELLASVARAWSSSLPDGAFLARYGGDEFALLLIGRSLVDAERVVELVLNSSPEEASAGLALWDRREPPSELVARADAALLRAKRSSRGRVVVAPTALGADRFDSWSTRLDEVLDRRFLTSAYQPIVSLRDGGVLGYEALLRTRGSHAVSSVEELFQTAERLGQSRALDWLGRRSALECAGGLPDGTALFVNVSARALADPVHGTDQMLMLLQWAQRTADEVVLEISEREMISNLGRFCEVLADYRDHGFRFAHDDVGEGHSTLEVLAAARGEFIKVARSLTESVHLPGPRSAVRAIVTFAESSGARVIAEGISHPSMAGVMRELGVEFGQGYALGAPAYLAATPLVHGRVAG